MFFDEASVFEIVPTEILVLVFYEFFGKGGLSDLSWAPDKDHFLSQISFNVRKKIASKVHITEFYSDLTKFIQMPSVSSNKKGSKMII
jgi:hypothetical protein